MQAVPDRRNSKEGSCAKSSKIGLEHAFKIWNLGVWLMQLPGLCTGGKHNNCLPCKSIALSSLQSPRSRKG